MDDRFLESHKEALVHRIFNSPCFVIQYLFILRLVHSLWVPDFMHWILVFLHFLFFFFFSHTLYGGLLEECKSFEFISSFKRKIININIYFDLAMSSKSLI